MAHRKPSKSQNKIGVLCAKLLKLEQNKSATIKSPSFIRKYPGEHCSFYIFKQLIMVKVRIRGS